MTGLLVTAYYGLDQAKAQTAPPLKIYTCRDASGRMITSDRPIPECADRVQRELGETGNVIKEIPPPMSIKERQIFEAQQEEKRKELVRQQEGARRDRALLIYKTEADLEMARQRSLSFPNDQIKGAEQRIVAAQKELQLVESQLADPAGKPSFTVKRRKEELDTIIRTETIFIADRREDITHIQERFNGELIRYRQLMAQSK